MTRRMKMFLTATALHPAHGLIAASSLILLVLVSPRSIVSIFTAPPTALSISLEHWPQVNHLPYDVQLDIAFFAHYLDRLYLILRNDSVLSYGHDKSDPNFYLLGLGPNVAEVSSPREIHELRSKGIMKLCSSYYHMLALTTTGEVYSWGWNGDGQLGNGYTSNNYKPIRVPLPVKMTDIACGHYSSYALPGAGSDYLYAWGGNNNGQLGLGHLEKQIYATPVNVTDAVAIEFAYHLMYILVLTASGDVYGWGYGGARRPEVLNVDSKSAIALAGTWSYGMILTGDGRLYRKDYRRHVPKLFYEGERRFRQVAADRSNRREFVVAETEETEIVVWRNVRRGGAAFEVIPLVNLADAFGIFVQSQPLLSFMAAPAAFGDRSLQVRCHELVPIADYIQEDKTSLFVPNKRISAT